MAVPALPEPVERLPGRSGVDNLPEADREPCLHAAKLYGLGYDRRQIARVMATKMFKDKEWGHDKRLARARNRLRAWERKQWFRDLVWDTAVVELDMTTPQILRGIARKAKSGRVDAAKLALGITGRYTERNDQSPSAVTINLVGITRPAARQAVEANSEAEIVYED